MSAFKSGETAKMLLEAGLLPSQLHGSQQKAARLLLEQSQTGELSSRLDFKVAGPLCCFVSGVVRPNTDVTWDPPKRHLYISFFLKHLYLSMGLCSHRLVRHHVVQPRACKA